MSIRTQLQKLRLIQLAERIEERPATLGVGVNHQCWGGVARDMAREHDSRITSYFGLTGIEIIDSMARNNRCYPDDRNARMACETRRLASA